MLVHMRKPSIGPRDSKMIKNIKPSKTKRKVRFENSNGSSHFLFGTITTSFNSCQGNQQFETLNIETTSKASRVVRYLIHF